MLSRLRISTRLAALIVIQAIILIVIGTWSITGLNFAISSTATLNRNVSEGTQLGYMADTIREDLLATVLDVDSGLLSWEDGMGRLGDAQNRLDQDWAGFIADLTPDEREFIGDVLAPELEYVRLVFATLARVFETQNQEELEHFIRVQADDLVQPFLSSALASSAERQLASAQIFENSLQFNRLFLYVNVAIVVAGVVLAGLLGLLIYRSISRPITVISDAVAELSEGNFDVRCKLPSRDELGDLGAALDGLLDDKMATLAKAESENERLNDSVIRLLEAVDDLSRRDLTVQVPVSPDVTGPVADAINKMTEEFARVLGQVAKIATHVGAASTSVNKRAIAVNSVATVLRKEVERTAVRLAEASKALEDIASAARRCSAQAERTTDSTEQAMAAVQGTLDGMHEMRESIQHTGKRIKRLGDRSQEITGIVDIIGTIAERTHMLALNASMQAASAGEAGRAFGVVADEVQRLAESSRDATRQIGVLVRNIQIDTNDTIVTMDKTIGLVVDGTKLAESAGRQMALTRDTTADLVGTVRQVESESTEQSAMSSRLQEQSSAIVERTVETADGMTAQLAQTKTLAQYSQVLNKVVKVFALPNKLPPAGTVK